LCIYFTELTKENAEQNISKQSNQILSTESKSLKKKIQVAL